MRHICVVLGLLPLLSACLASPSGTAGTGGAMSQADDDDDDPVTPDGGGNDPIEPDEPRSCELRPGICECGTDLQGSEVCGECVCDDPIPTNVQSDCMSPCGGDLTGSWELTTICHPEFARDSCVHYQRSGTSEISPSALGFHPEGYLYGNINFFAQWQLQMSEACMRHDGFSCNDQLSQALNQQFGFGSCGEIGNQNDCFCTIGLGPIADEFQSQYLADDTTLVLGDKGPFEYCVDGDELRMRVNENEMTYVMTRSTCPVTLPNCAPADLPFVPSNFPDLQTALLPRSDGSVYTNCEDGLILNTDTLGVSCGYGVHAFSELRSQGEGLPDVAVFYFNTVGGFTLEGSRPAVIVANSIVISGAVSFGAEGPTSAPTTANGRNAVLSDTPASGGGASHCTAGGRGGRGQLPGMIFDDVTSTTLWPGAQGGSSNIGALGGNGGMAIQLIAKEEIRITADGSIGVSGGGLTHEYGDGGRGGGSGGTILLEAPIVTVAGRLTAAGGRGGSAFYDDMPLGSDGSAPGEDAESDREGGGGGAGKILIFADTMDLTGATILPHPDTSPTCAQFGPLTSP